MYEHKLRYENLQHGFFTGSGRYGIPELNGIEVVPTICWSGENSFEWCFDGEPIGGTVAVSSVGTQRSREAKAAFLHGYNEMMKRLNPSAVVFYGSVPNECEGNIIHIDAFQEKFRKERK